MEDRVVRVPGESMVHAIGLPVIDSAGVRLGVVVGRIISGTAVDLLVRRRRPFRRSRYLRLEGAAITITGQTAMYLPPAGTRTVRLEVVQANGTGVPVKGDAA